MMLGIAFYNVRSVRSLTSSFGFVRGLPLRGRHITTCQAPNGDLYGKRVRHVVAEQATKSSSRQARCVAEGGRISTERQIRPSPATVQRFDNGVKIALDGLEQDFSPILLRDLCTCHQCVDQSTKQKLFSTTAIPLGIQGDLTSTETGIDIKWTDDVNGYGDDHVTHVSYDSLKSLFVNGTTIEPFKMPPRVLWDDNRFRKDISDIPYKSYMSDDHALLEALVQLHTHGLLFLTDVPESESSVSTIAERIGPLKNTFYGMTWDVRSVPQAKNVAYTSQDLDFHMDLLYMTQPPHLQLLHCIRSSSSGGASTFTDSLKAVADLFQYDRQLFTVLECAPVDFHYNHPDSEYYRQSRFVIEPRRLRIRGRTYRTVAQKSQFIWENLPTDHHIDHANVTDWIDAVSWAPPFQAPFSLASTGDKFGTPLNIVGAHNDEMGPLLLGNRVDQWRSAAQKFDELIHRPEGLHERMMKPGDCVIFDNRRVLHARRAFEVGDAGKERWLRGAYLDKDPYMSKLRVLQHRLGRAS